MGETFRIIIQRVILAFNCNARYLDKKKQKKTEKKVK